MSPIVAGSDSTAGGLRATIFHLCANPQCLEKLRKEIGKSSSDPVTYVETCRMPYLNACIKEALRCEPPVGFPLQRVVPRGGRELAGRFYPSGTNVGVNARVVHKDKK